MTKKIRVAILFGGKSAEHEVSIKSAKNILNAIDKNKYEPVLIGIDKNGHWLPPEESQSLLHEGKVTHFDESQGLSFVPQDSGIIIDKKGNIAVEKIDVVFPVLHGPFGEDGTIQGFLKIANIPFVGAGVLGSAIGMDKDVMKRLLRDAHIPIANFLTYKKYQIHSIDFSFIKDKLGIPFFIKPANLGSSVGISKITDDSKFKEALDEAFNFDTKIIIEENIVGREIECSVLGNEHPIASQLGEIISQHEFYSYDAKYLDENGAVLKIPAELEKNTITEIQNIAIKAYEVLCCEGMARADFFLTKNNSIYLNEINTIPGFTSTSMYPKLWEISGVSYSKLIDNLITLAIDRFKRESELKTSLD